MGVFAGEKPKNWISVNFAKHILQWVAL